MTARPITLRDPSHSVLATAFVEQRGGVFAGQVDLTAMPTEWRQVFDSFEAIVNGQMFSLLDDIEDRIRSLPLTLEFENGRPVVIQDLQIFPTSGRISFTLVANQASTDELSPLDTAQSARVAGR